MEAAQMVARSAAMRYGAVPVAFASDGALIVAVEDPFDTLGISDIEVMTRSSVRPAIATASGIEALVERLPDQAVEKPPAEEPPVEEPPRNFARSANGEERRSGWRRSRLEGYLEPSPAFEIDVPETETAVPEFEPMVEVVSPATVDRAGARRWSRLPEIEPVVEFEPRLEVEPATEIEPVVESSRRPSRSRSSVEPSSRLSRRRRSSRAQRPSRLPEILPDGDVQPEPGRSQSTSWSSFRSRRGSSPTSSSASSSPSADCPEPAASGGGMTDLEGELGSLQETARSRR